MREEHLARLAVHARGEISRLKIDDRLAVFSEYGRFGSQEIDAGPKRSGRLLRAKDQNG